MHSQKIRKIPKKELENYLLSFEQYTQNQDVLSAQLPTWTGNIPFDQWEPWSERTDARDHSLQIVLIKEDDSECVGYMTWDTESIEWLMEQNSTLFHLADFYRKDPVELPTIDF